MTEHEHHDHDHAAHDHADHDHADHDHAAHDHAAHDHAVDDASIAKPFDNTNGVVEGLEGDSDGTVDSDSSSAAERDPGVDDVPGAPLITNQP